MRDSQTSLSCVVMPSQGPTYRFGPFELRVRTRQLLKHGSKLKLRPQPFCILQILLKRQGDVVTREELHELLWPGKAFVDFEHGINNAIKELRGALSDSAGKPHIIETLPRLGYRVMVPVSYEEPAASTIAGNEGTLEQAAPLAALSERHIPEKRVVWHWPLALVLSVLSGAALSVYVAWWQPSRQSQASGHVTLAVLPFENLTGDSGREYFSDGLTEEMIAQLGRLDPQHLAVIARTSVMHYKHDSTPLEKVGRELGVQYALEGSVRLDADKVRISAQLIQLRDQTRIWSRQYDRELTSLLTLQGEIAQEITDEIVLTLGGEHISTPANRKAAFSPRSYQAYDSYLKGRYFWNKRTKEGFEQAAGYFQQSVTQDPSYARAYAGLADTYGLMSTWLIFSPNEYMPKARSAALKGLQIDETLAEAHASLALVAENFDYDWQTAEKEFRRAIQLDPTYATAHQWYAESLAWQGRFDEALAESERARQIDPLSLIIAADHGNILYLARQYDRAIAQLHAVLDMDKGFPYADGCLLASYFEKGNFAEALEDIERRPQGEAQPEAWVWISKARLYGKWGRPTQAQHALSKAEPLFRAWPAYQKPFLATMYAALGQNERALGLLKQAYLEHSSPSLWMKVEPSFDPLRSDPRFQDLLHRIRLAN